MNKTVMIPVVVQQLIENLHSKANPSHITYNYMISLENIRDTVSAALSKHYKDKNFK
jgi:uncharacterized protein (DUF433 family)